MKKFYLVLSLLCGSLSSSAQTYTINPSNSVSTTIQVNDYVTSTISFENISGASLNLRWDLIEKIAPTGWDYSFCDYTTCYDASYTHGSMTPIPAGQSGFIKVNVNTTNEGWAYFKFGVYDVNTPNDIDTIEFWFNAILGISEQVVEQPVLFPNPVNENTAISLTNLHVGSSVAIYNNSGQLVYKKDNLNSSTTIIEQKLNKGIYFVKSSNHGSTTTQKLVVQ